jgi:hypothetical protein
MGWWSDVNKSAEYHRHIQEDTGPNGEPHPAVGEDWEEVYRKEEGTKGLYDQHKAGK